MKITKGTVIRTVLLVLVIVNLILKHCGLDVIDADENDIANIIEMLISVAVIILNWWKNNSFTKNAQAADEYLKALKNFDESEE